MVAMANVAPVAPAATATLAGTVARDVLLLESAITAPPAGAGAVSVAVPVEPAEPVTLEGLMLIDNSAGAAGAPWGVKVRTDDQDPAVPALFRARTRHECVRFSSVPVCAYCDPVRFVRCTTYGLESELELSIWISYDAAFATSVQSNVIGWGTLLAPDAGNWSDGAPGTVLAAVMFSVALRLTPRVAVIVAEVLDTTDCVVTAKVRLVEPAATVTVDGTVASELLLESDTTVPPDGAAPVSVTVPVDVLPPVTVDGLSVSEDSVGPLTVPAVTVSIAVHVVLSNAEIRAPVVVDTFDVKMVNVAVC